MATTFAARFRALFFGSADLGAIDFVAVLTGLRRLLRLFLTWLESIHVDMAAELALASSGITMPFSCASFSANNICAGLAGLEADAADIPASAFLGAC